MTTVMDEEAIRAVVFDYVEGWLDGDAGRMERALHPELMKRCRGLEGDDPDALETLSAREMIDATADGVGRAEDAPDRQIEVTIDRRSMHDSQQPMGARTPPSRDALGAAGGSEARVPRRWRVFFELDARGAPSAEDAHLVSCSALEPNSVFRAWRREQEEVRRARSRCRNRPNEISSGSIDRLARRVPPALVIRWNQFQLRPPGRGSEATSLARDALQVVAATRADAARSGF